MSYDLITSLGTVSLSLITPTTQVTQMPLPTTIVQPRVARTSLSLSAPRIRTSQTYINLFKVPYIYIYIYVYMQSG